MRGARVLFISPLDRRVVANTREQNMAEMFEASGCTTVSLTLAQNTSRQLKDIVRDTLTWRSITLVKNKVFCIDPWLNPCTGLHTNMQASPTSPSAPQRLSVKRAVVKMLSPLGIARDWIIIPTMLLHALRLGKLDVCIAYGPWAACVGWLLRGMGRVSTLVYDDQDFEPAIMRNRWRQQWAAFLERTMMRKADHVVSVGHRLAQLRREQTGRTVTVIPNGVHLHSHSAQQSAPPAKNDGVLRLVYVGNVVPWSGLDCMLPALVQVRAQGIAVQVRIIGDGLPSYVDALKETVNALALQECVEFVGRIPNTEVQRWLVQADVGLAHFRPEPYRQYAFPLKVVEYMQAGLAIIGTQDTETQDILAQHDIGLSVPFSVEGIAQAIEYLAKHPDQRHVWQHNALASVHQYQWRALAEAELALVFPPSPPSPPSPESTP
jgi:glycosyltransferase involved in cell wall biosynthesis